MPVLQRLDHHERDHQDREDADGQVHVEDPAPRQVLGEEATDERPDDRPESEHDREDHRDLRALLDRVHVGHDRLRDREDAAGAGALEPAEENELQHRARGAAQDRAEHEDHHPGEEDLLAPVHVGEAAPQRDRRDLREQVRGEHPGVVVEAVQVADDGRHRGGDDGAVERGEEHARDDGRQREPSPARADARRVRGGQAHDVELRSAGATSRANCSMR